MEFLKVWGASLLFFVVVHLVKRRIDRKVGPRNDSVEIQQQLKIQRELDRQDAAMWDEHWEEIARRRLKNTDF